MVKVLAQERPEFDLSGLGRADRRLSHHTDQPILFIIFQTLVDVIAPLARDWRQGWIHTLAPAEEPHREFPI